MEDIELRFLALPPPAEFRGMCADFENISHSAGAVQPASQPGIQCRRTTSQRANKSVNIQIRLRHIWSDNFHCMQIFNQQLTVPSAEESRWRRREKFFPNKIFRPLSYNAKCAPFDRQICKIPPCHQRHPLKERSWRGWGPRCPCATYSRRSCENTNFN